MAYRKLDDDSLNRQASVLLPALKKNERIFFDLVTNDDVQIVEDFLHENPGFNINCVNFQGVSALHVAVQNRSEEMVELLISFGATDAGDCALLAVRLNAPRILELLLRGPDVSTGSSTFPDHVTPLVLAAQCGHYDMIGLLIERGHRVPRPHKPGCLCAACRLGEQDEDPLHVQTRRLHLYRAISNPAYICHTTADPIFASFSLARELERRACLEPEFRAGYARLSEEAGRFAVDLLGHCRTASEVELVLRQPGGNSKRLGSRFKFPRIALAMDLRQKAFVAHPHAQHAIEAAWHGGTIELTRWREKCWLARGFLVAFRAVTLPAVAAVVIVAPRSSLALHWALPVHKMVSHTASYATFLALAFAQSNSDKRDQRRGAPGSGLEPFLVLYVVGFAWSRARLAVLQGPGRYLRLLWSWYDLTMVVMFLCTFFLWAAAREDVRVNDDADLERKYWHQLDATLLAEGAFAVATIMAFCRALFLCQLNYHLGPLQISLGKMSVDIARFAVIFAVIMISFAAGLCRLYQYYGGMVQVDPGSGIKTVQQSSFVDLPSTLKTLFWALFCMSPIESADVVIENLPAKNGEENGDTIINKHQFTEAVGYLCFACFEVLCVIVILNMLIATMSNTFQRVTDNSDIEWTFGRMEVYVQYMLQTTLPPPYNLLPTIAGVSKTINWAREKLGASEKNLSTSDLEEEEQEKQVVREYPALASQLVQRYFRDKEAEAASSGAELEALRQEIAQLRTVIRHMSKPNV